MATLTHYSARETATQDSIFTTLTPFVLQPGVGEVFQNTPSERFVWKATAETTGGVFDCFESFIQPGQPGVPEHIHDTVDEIFYVLEGKIRYKLGDNVLNASAGAFAYVPKGTPHTWLNVGDGVARMLTQFMPGGMRGFFEATSQLLQADPPEIAALIAEAGRWDTRVVGPPIVAGSPPPSA